jgi:hypothetical protein
VLKFLILFAAVLAVAGAVLYFSHREAISEHGFAGLWQPATPKEVKRVKAVTSRRPSPSSSTEVARPVVAPGPLLVVQNFRGTDGRVWLNTDAEHYEVGEGCSYGIVKAVRARHVVVVGYDQRPVLIVAAEPARAAATERTVRDLPARKEIQSAGIASAKQGFRNTAPTLRR